MFASIPPDVAGPGVFILFGLAAFLVFSAIVLVLEAVLLWLIRWDTFGRSLLSSFLMNLTSTVLGVLLIGLLLTGLLNSFLGFTIAFVLSVLIEVIILMMIKRDAVRENWRAAIIANFTSYTLLGIFLLYIS
jgi:hypothetical protein